MLLFSLLLLSFALQANPEKEYEIKAAFIVKLVGFITWPGRDSSVPSTEKLNFCIADSNKSSHFAEHTIVAHGNLKAHFTILPFNASNSCHIVYVPHVSELALPPLLEEIKSAGPILTISDNAGYAQSGVMINFFNEDQKIGFEINWDRMTSQGFEISSRVLKLARLVNGR